MNPLKVVRANVHTLTDLPNVGPATAGDLRRLGIQSPDDVRGQDAYALYEALCTVSGQRHDPCVIDVFLSITRFMAGGDAQPWWAFTEERKAHLAAASRHA